MAIFSLGSYNAADNPTWTTLAGLANNGSAMSSTIDNSAADASGGLFLYGDVLLNMGASVTAGAGTPTVQVYALWSPDGVNFPSPPGAVAGAAGLHMLATYALLVPSTGFQVVTFPTFRLRPSPLRLMVYNGTGAPFGAGATCTLFRYKETVA